jgi:type III pantothenate kinase
MTLLIDIGNSRIKWATVRGGDAAGARSRQRSLPLRGDGAAAFRRLLRGTAARGGVLAVNVAGTTVERALRRAARAARAPTPVFVRPARAAAGLVNGYREPWRLGADRWVAMLGARHVADGAPVCVIDVGTALTVDVVDGEGRHHGGYIAPGPHLMVDALLRGTRGIRRRARGAPRAGGAWPRATLPALQQGGVEACAGLIARSHADARRQFGARTRLIVTGGGAAALAGRLPARARLVPDLVLEGLQVWARATC